MSDDGTVRGVDQVSKTRVVDDNFCAAPARTVRMVEIDHEAILLDDARQAVYALNPTGTLIWRCLDGLSPVGEICDDLAFALEAPLDIVKRDTFDLVEQLLEAGMAFDRRIGEAPTTFRGPTPPVTQRLLHADTTEVLTVLVGRAVVSVSCNNARLSETLRVVLASMIVNDSTAQTHLFLDVGIASGELLAMSYLYVDERRVLATSSTGHVVRAALAHLAGFAQDSNPFMLSGRLLLHDRGAMIISASFGCLIEVGSRRLIREGWRTAHQTVSVVDSDTLEVIVGEHRLNLDPEGLQEIDRLFPSESDESQIVPGRYPLLAMVSVGYRNIIGRTESPATRVTQLAHFLKSSNGLRASDLQQLAVLSGQVDVEWMMGNEPREFTDLLRRLAKSRPVERLDRRRPV